MLRPQLSRLRGHCSGSSLFQISKGCRFTKLTQAAAHRPRIMMSSPPIKEYRVGWVCALPIEMAAARAMLDEEHGPIPSQEAQDSNNYVVGKVHNHNVVISC